ENKWLRKTVNEVIRKIFEDEAAAGDLFPDCPPIQGSRDSDVCRCNDVAAKHSGKIADDGERRNHDEGCEQSRRHELPNWIGAEGVERVDLFGDSHRSNLC